MQKAQPQIGELKDYTAFFIGNSYVLSNSPEESLAYLRDFGTRFPDSLYTTTRRSRTRRRCWPPIVRRGDPTAGGASLARQRRDRVLPRQSLCAERAGPQRSRDPAARLLQLRDELHRRPGRCRSRRRFPRRRRFRRRPTREHLRRAEALYKARRYPAAAEEYRTWSTCSSRTTVGRADSARQLPTCNDGNTRAAREALDRIPDDGSDASAEKWYQQVEIARNAKDDASLSNILQHMRATTPKSPWLESALLTTGNMYLLRKDYDRAIDYYREIHERFPERHQGRLCALEVRLAHLRAAPPGAGEEVLRGAGRVLSRHQRSPQCHVLARPHGGGRRDYGIARAYYRKLSDRYRNYYYGVLARKRLATCPGRTGV